MSGVPVPVKPAGVPALAITAAPVLLTLTITLTGIGQRQLWRDEHATWWAACLPLSDLRRLVEVADLVLLPYYLLMHGWIRLAGDSPTALRLPSALAMALAAGLLALLGRRLFDARAGALAGLLLPLVPAVSRYGQEARPYALTLAASVAAFLLLLRALEKPTGRRWCAYASAVVAVGGTHLVALTALAAHLLAVLLADRRAARSWLAAVGAALALLAPLIGAASRQGGQIDWIPAPTAARVAAFPGQLFLSEPVAVLTIGAALAGVIITRHRRAALLLVWGLVPPLATCLAFDLVGLFHPRYLLFTVPAWVLGAAFCVRVVARPPLVAVAAVLAIGLAGLPVQRYLRADPLHGEIAFAAAARHLAAHARPGEGVAYAGYRRTHRAFAYEFGRLDRPMPRDLLTVDPPGRPWWWTRPACPAPADCLAGVRRFWLVATDPGADLLRDLPPATRAVVADRYRYAASQRFPGVTVALLVLR